MTAIPTDRRLADAVAGGPARAVSALAAVLVLWLLGDVTGSPQLFWWPLLAWGVGIAVGVAVPEVRTLFRSYSGFAVAVVVAAVLSFGMVVLFAVTESTADPPVHAYLLALVPLGLDWHLVQRLRVRLLVTGFAVVLLVGLDGAGTWSTSRGGGAVLVAMVWFATALVALWLLHRDQLGALPRPSPLGGTLAAEGPRGLPTDFLVVAGVSALAAVVLALVVAGPSCLPWERCARSGAPFDPMFGGIEGSPGDTSGFPSYPGGGPDGDGGFGGEGDHGLGGDGNLYFDSQGRAYAYDPESDRYLRVPPADAYGYDRGTGYHYDGDGLAYRYDGRTDTYRRAPEGDHLVPDGDGRFFRKDRDGELWLPYANGKPLPPGARLGEGKWLPSPGPSGGDRPPGGSEADRRDRDWGGVGRVVGGLLVLAGLLGLAVWWLRRGTDADEVDAPDPVAPPDRPWAEAMAQRLMAIGARHGRARASGEPVGSYGRALAVEPVGDPRLAAVAASLSAALFGPTDAPPEERAWVEAVLDEIDASDAAADEPQPAGVSG